MNHPTFVVSGKTICRIDKLWPPVLRDNYVSQETLRWICGLMNEDILKRKQELQQ